MGTILHLTANNPKFSFLYKILFVSSSDTTETLKMIVFHDAVMASPIQEAAARLAVTGKSTKAQERVLFDRAFITYNKQAFEEESRGSLLKKLCCRGKSSVTLLNVSKNGKE